MGRNELRWGWAVGHSSKWWVTLIDLISLECKVHWARGFCFIYLFVPRVWNGAWHLVGVK